MKDCDKMIGDYDVQAIVNTLSTEEYYELRSWHTVLVEDEKTGEHYVIRNICIDKDDDVVFKVRHL